MVKSLGTGSKKGKDMYIASKATNWGVLGWLANASSTPLVDALTQHKLAVKFFQLCDIIE